MPMSADPRLTQLAADMDSHITRWLEAPYQEANQMVGPKATLKMGVEAAYDLGHAAGVEQGNAETESLRAQVECLAQPHEAVYRHGVCDGVEQERERCEVLGKRLDGVIRGFRDESLNGVVCSIPDEGITTKPHRTWCQRCKNLYLELIAIAAAIRAAREAP
jgi:hypothetical protein